MDNVWPGTPIDCTNYRKAIEDFFFFLGQKSVRAKLLFLHLLIKSWWNQGKGSEATKMGGSVKCIKKSNFTALVRNGTWESVPSHPSQNIVG